MSNSTTTLIFLTLIIILVLFPPLLTAQESIGVKFGYGRSLNDANSTNIIQIIPHLTYIPHSVSSFMKLELGQEIPIGLISSFTETTEEIGMGLFGRVIFFPEGQFQPFVGAIIGVSFNNTNVEEIKTSFNFSEQVEWGVRLLRENNGEIDISMRLRHISNGGLEDENSDFNTWHIIVGYAREW